MRILLHGINYVPELTGVGKYTGELGAWLAAQGHEVRAVVAPPYYPAWRVDPPYSAFKYHTEVIDGVRVTRTPVYVPANPRGLTRILHLLSFALFSLPVLLTQVFWRPHVVIVFEPTFAVVPQAWFTARVSGANAWLHVQDFEVDAAFRLDMMGGQAGIFARLATSLEGWWMRRFDRISAISHSMVKRLRAKGVDESKTIHFENWVDLSSICRMATIGAAEAFEAFKIPGVRPGERVVLYSGNLGEKQGLEYLLSVAETFATGPQNVRFVICGEGSAKARLVAEVERRGLENVTFLPLQSNEEFPRLLAAADLHLVLQRRNAADLVMPSKLVGICAIGGAAIVTADTGTELHNVVAGNDLGCVVRPEDSRALEQAIARLLIDEKQRTRYGEAAREYAKDHLEKEAVLTRFEKALAALVFG